MLEFNKRTDEIIVQFAEQVMLQNFKIFFNPNQETKRVESTKLKTKVYFILFCMLSNSRV